MAFRRAIRASGGGRDARTTTSGGGLCGPLAIALLIATGAARAAQPDTREMIEHLQRQIDALQEEMSRKDERIEQLERRLREMPAPSEEATDEQRRRDALLRALDEIERAEAQREAARPPGIVSAQVGGANLRLIDVSMDVLLAGGGSSERDESLGNLQGGGHDPRQRGFTLQQAELSFTGAVDPYLYGEAHLILSIDPIEGETITELEEAFMQTQTLPWGVQVEGGFFFTEFGLINPRHPHAWDWLDQPVINTRLFGPDGLRQAGLRLGWLTPLPWFSELHFGVQNANGETAASFLANDEFFGERAIGGLAFAERDVRSMEDLIYLLRWVNGFDLTDELSAQVGLSGLLGPNATGGDGETRIYGADLVVKWRAADHYRGWPFITWQSEIMKRDYDVDRSNANFVTGELEDWGFYTQLLWGFMPNWAAGLRYELASGGGGSFDPEAGAPISRDDDPFRDDRQRISPLLVWQPTEFSRIRLQYNYDIAEHLDDDDAHSVWIGFEFLFGAHPAHTY